MTNQATQQAATEQQAIDFYSFFLEMSPQKIRELELASVQINDLSDTILADTNKGMTALYLYAVIAQVMKDSEKAKALMQHLEQIYV
jgi:hypothetical protein